MPASEKLRRGDWEIRDVTQAEARDAVERWHYAGGCTNTSVARHGLFRRDDDKLQGVAMWLPPTKPAAVSVDPERWRGVLALTRLVVDDDVPTNGASFLLGGSMRRLDRARWPVLLTYADTALGHTGAIYRATNWEYVGQRPGSDNWIGPDGQRRGRKRGGRNFSAAEMRAMGYVKVPAQPKHKFVHRASNTRRPLAEIRG